MHKINALVITLGLCPVAATSLGANSIRAAMLSNSDAVPGIPGATFASAQTGQVIIDRDGRVSFATSTASPNSSGIWSEAVDGFAGSLHAVVLEGAATPGVAGGAFQSLSGARLVGSDNGHLAFTHTLSLAGSPVGIWMLDGPALGLFAFTGQAAPTSPAGLWNLNFITWPTAMTSDGVLAVVTGFSVGTTNYLAAFQGNTLARSMCSRTEPDILSQGFASFSPPQMNSRREFSLPAAYRFSDGTRSGIFTGKCAALASTVIHQQTIPAYVGLSSGSTFISPTNLGFSDDPIAFVTTISGTGVGSGNDSALWVYRGGTYTLVAREGDQVPGLPAGCFYVDFKNGSLSGPVASASGHIAWAGNIYGPGTTASTNRVVMQRDTSGVVRVVTRSGDQPSGYPAGTTISSLGSGLAMNSLGQLCFTAALAGQPVGRGSVAVLATDLTQQLTLLYESGQTQTIRPGLTAVVGAPTTEPLITGGTDGLPRNWNNRGEFAFRASYAIPGGASGYGLFVVGLPSCPADFNNDGFLDFSDFDDFVGAFEAGNAISDFNNDGFLDFSDFDAFVTAFESGC